jgi:alanine-glyoxylate transaminase/serine-glyoxylate transaminase/serine-pyruvate transaminase
LDLVCTTPAEYSSTLTAVLMPEGHSEIVLRQAILEKFNMSLGSGLGKWRDKVFRIGHLGDFNELMLCGTLCGIEMGLALAGVPHRAGGVAAAMAALAPLSESGRRLPAGPA